MLAGRWKMGHKLLRVGLPEAQRTRLSMDSQFYLSRAKAGLEAKPYDTLGFLRLLERFCWGDHLVEQSCMVKRSVRVRAKDGHGHNKLIPLLSRGFVGKGTDLITSKGLHACPSLRAASACHVPSFEPLESMVRALKYHQATHPLTLLSEADKGHPKVILSEQHGPHWRPIENLVELFLSCTSSVVNCHRQGQGRYVGSTYRLFEKNPTSHSRCSP